MSALSIPGKETLTARMIEAIATRGPIRGDQLGDAVGRPTSSVSATLRPYTGAGFILALDARRDDKRPVSEYRLAPGIDPKAWRDALASWKPQAAVELAEKPAANSLRLDDASFTLVEQALLLIARRGTVASAAIAAEIGIKAGSVDDLLVPEVDRGILVRGEAAGIVDWSLGLTVSPDMVLAERRERMVATGQIVREPKPYRAPTLPPRAAAALAAADGQAHVHVTGDARPAPNPLTARSLVSTATVVRTGVEPVSDTASGLRAHFGQQGAASDIPEALMSVRILDDKRRITYGGVRYNASAPGLKPGDRIRVCPVVTGETPLLAITEAGDRYTLTRDGRGPTPVVASKPEVATSAVVASADALPAVPGPAGDPHCPAGTGSQQAEPPFSVTKSSSPRSEATSEAPASPEETPAAAVGAAVAGVASQDPAALIFDRRVDAAPLGQPAEPLHFELKGELIEFEDIPEPAYALLSDGRLTIRNGDDMFVFGASETARLQRFLTRVGDALVADCDLLEQIDARR